MTSMAMKGQRAIGSLKLQNFYPKLRLMGILYNKAEVTSLLMILLIIYELKYLSGWR